MASWMGHNVPVDTAGSSSNSTATAAANNLNTARCGSCCTTTKCQFPVGHHSCFWQTTIFSSDSRLTCRCVARCTCPYRRSTCHPSSLPSSLPCCPCPCRRRRSSCWGRSCGTRQHGLRSVLRVLRQVCSGPAVRYGGDSL